MDNYNERPPTEEIEGPDSNNVWLAAAAGSAVASASVTLGIITEPAVEPQAGIIAGGFALVALGALGRFFRNRYNARNQAE